MFQVNGFYGHVRRNDLRSAALFIGFGLAFELAAAVALALPLMLLDARHAPILHPTAYVMRYGAWVWLAGTVLFLGQYFLYGVIVQQTAGFCRVERADQARLVNIVETLAIAAGLPPPKVGLMDNDARNAFACGLTPASAVIVVTRGLLDALDDDELSAVVAHEIAHILHGDIRLMAAANILVRNLTMLTRNNPLRWRGGRQMMLLLIPPILLLIVVSAVLSAVAIALGRATRLVIASSREFIADAEAVRLTHNPGALISALRKVEGRSSVPWLDGELDAMMIDGAVEGEWASHPSIGERVAVLARLSGELARASRRHKDTRPAVAQSAVPAGVTVSEPVMYGRKIALLDADPGPAVFGRKTAPSLPTPTLKPELSPADHGVWEPALERESLGSIFARVTRNTGANALDVSPVFAGATLKKDAVPLGLPFKVVCLLLIGVFLASALRTGRFTPRRADERAKHQDLVQTSVPAAFGGSYDSGIFQSRRH